MLNNYRQIVLDIETTGLNITDGHRVIEIAAVEMLDRKITGNYFHCYTNPKRKVDLEALRVHGLTDDFLKDKPIFANIAAEFMAFINGNELIIHNAAFDVSFLNQELLNIKWPTNITENCKIFDTLLYARQKHVGQRNSLDALCKRYDINNSHRTLHGALLDAEILAAVYLAMTGGQIDLFNDDNIFDNNDIAYKTLEISHHDNNNQHIIIHPTIEELTKHKEFMHFIVEQSGIDLSSS